jgi:hypothetical protein
MLMAKYPSIEPTAVSVAVRRQIAQRYGATPDQPVVDVRCYYCSTGTGTITVDATRGTVRVAGLQFRRLIPLAKGGSSDADNLVLACRGCRSPHVIHLLRHLNALEGTP